MPSALAFAALLLAPPAVAEVLDGVPCAGCVTVVPDRAPDAGPLPLLVALHGDGGGVRPLVRAWRRAAEKAGVILLAPRCPRDLGCTAGSWWQWLTTSGHDPAWLGAQIDAIEARFPVDRARVFATGYSGGATYLGWYVPWHPERFGAIAHVAGGARYGGPCPACKVPVLFVLGATDPMIGPYTRPLHEWYALCGGHENVWEILPGVTHESILATLEQGRAKEILAWLLARPAACVEPVAADGGASDAGAVVEDAGVPQAVPEARSDARAEGDAPPAPPPVAPSAAGCTCEVGSERSLAGGAAALAAILAACARRRRASAARRRW
jgi:predicted esterase